MAVNPIEVKIDQKKIERIAFQLQRIILEANIFINLDPTCTARVKIKDIPAETKKYKDSITNTLHGLNTEEELNEVLNFEIEHDNGPCSFSALSLAEARGRICLQPLSQKVANARLYLAVINNDVAKVKALIQTHGRKGDNLLDFEQIYPLTHHNTILAIAASTRCSKTLRPCPEICVLLLEAGASIKPYYGRSWGKTATEQTNYLNAIGEKIVNGHELLNIIRSLKNDKLTKMAESAAKQDDGILKKQMPSILAFQFQTMLLKPFYSSILCSSKRRLRSA